jgi:phage gpG-like protein
MNNSPLTLDTLQPRLAATVKAAIDTPVKPIMQVITQLGVADVKRNIAEGHSPDGRPFVTLARGRPGGSGGHPLLNSGDMMASINGRTTNDGFIVGTNKVQANLMNYGGVITPKRSKYLAIPATKAAQRAGSPRRYAGRLSPRIGKRGGVLIDEKSGEIAYYLVRRVSIPARPFLGFSDSFYQKVERLIVEQAQKRVDAAG